MASSDTWIVTDVGHAPVGIVAAMTLRKRFGAVWAELEAACVSPDDPEHVHQLRVATRRTLAAIDAFCDLVPARRRAWFEKRLGRLRRVAGEARDLDVMTGRMAPTAAATARARLAAMLAKRREQSRRPIREQRERLLEEDWPAHVERLLAIVHDRGRKTSFREFARRRLKPIIADFFEKADRKVRRTAAIHALRIEGKKLRYAIEIFAPIVPPRARARCQKSLERLQETLGDCTDHAAAADRFERWARNAGKGPHREMLLSLRDDEHDRAEAARKSFSKWWSGSRRRLLRRRLERTVRWRSA